MVLTIPVTMNIAAVAHSQLKTHGCSDINFQNMKKKKDLKTGSVSLKREAYTCSLHEQEACNEHVWAGPMKDEVLIAQTDVKLPEGTFFHCPTL